jgi:hypothetical protein
MCCQQFHIGQAHEFLHHLIQHVDDTVAAAKRKRRASLPPSTFSEKENWGAHIVSPPLVLPGQKITLPVESEDDAAVDKSFCCQWQGCHMVMKRFTKKAPYKSHVTGFHNPFPLFHCLVNVVCL